MRIFTTSGRQVFQSSGLCATIPTGITQQGVLIAQMTITPAMPRAIGHPGM